MNYDLKERLKKYWFVILVAVLLTSVAIFFAIQTNKDTVAGKTSKGSDVIFTLDKQNYTADQYYDELFNTETGTGDNKVKNGDANLYTLMEKEVISQSVKADDKMEDTAQENADAARKSYIAQMGGKKAFKTFMDPQLKKLGYPGGVDEFDEYFLNQEKTAKFFIDYFKENPDVTKQLFEEESPRVISHILVKCADPANPTEEEKKKMEDVKKAVEKDGFAKTAKKMSDDTSSAENDGSLGLQYKSDSLDENFKDAAWKLENGKTSDWVKSQYGYHLIKIDETDKDKIIKDKNNLNKISSYLTTKDANFKKKVVWEKAQKLKIKFDSDETKNAIMKYIGVEESK